MNRHFKPAELYSRWDACYCHTTLAGLEGAEPAPPPPPWTTDRRRHGRLLMISENGTVLWRVLNFDCSAVKHALQNTRNDCHQWLSDSSKVSKFVFGRVLPRTPLGELTTLFRPPSWFKGALLLREWEVREERRGKGDDERGEEGTSVDDN